MSRLLYVLAILVLAVLSVLLLGPATSVEQSVDNLDKVAHFFAFGLVLWALGVLFRRRSRVVLAIITVVIGGLVELVQGQIGRDASWYDLLADALGVVTALLVWSGWRRFQPRSARRPVSDDR